MNNFDALIARLHERVHSPQGSTDSDADYPPQMRTPSASPLSPKEMTKAEAALGFALPALLYRLYSEVGNGGWGPGYGMEPLYQVAAQREEDRKQLVTVVTRAQYFREHKPELASLIQVADWGCAISSWVDTRHPDLPVLRCDPNLDDETLDQAVRLMGQEPEANPYHFFNAWRECDSLHAWLWAWVDGADLWTRGYPLEWAEEA